MVLLLSLSCVGKMLQVCSFGEMDILEVRVCEAQVLLERYLGIESSQWFRKRRDTVLCCSFEAEDQSEFASADDTNADDEV